MSFCNYNNYAHYYHTNSKNISIENINFEIRLGCNEHMRLVNNRTTYIRIPTNIVNSVINNINEARSKIDSNLPILTFDDIISEFEKMGFKYEISKISYNRTIRFLEDYYDEFYIFKLDKEYYESNQRRKIYFSFCMIRLFYYFNEILEHYCLLKDELSEYDKLILLGILAYKTGDPYSYVYNTSNLLFNQDFKSFLEYHSNIINNKSLMDHDLFYTLFSINKYKIIDSTINHELIDNIKKDIEKYKKIISTSFENPNVIVVSKNIENNLYIEYNTEISEYTIKPEYTEICNTILKQNNIKNITKISNNKGFYLMVPKINASYIVPYLENYIPATVITDNPFLNSLNIRTNNNSIIIYLKDKLLPKDIITNSNNKLIINKTSILKRLLCRYDIRRYSNYYFKELMNITSLNKIIVESINKVKNFKQIVIDNIQTSYINIYDLLGISKHNGYLMREYFEGDSYLVHISKNNGIFFVEKQIGYGWKEYTNEESVKFNDILNTCKILFIDTRLDIASLKILVSKDFERVMLLDISVENVNSINCAMKYYQELKNIINNQLCVD